MKELLLEFLVDIEIEKFAKKPIQSSKLFIYLWFLVEAKSAESWKPQDLNPREALSQLSCRELALREQLFNIFSFLDLNFHYMQTHSSFFMALKKRLVEKSLFHSSPGIYPAFALFATMLACFVTAFLYWTPYICTVFALDRT